MSTSYYYEIAYEHASEEIAAIEAQIQRLTHRKELLERLLEPLQHLVSESGSSPTPAGVSDHPETEFSPAERPAQASAAGCVDVLETESGPLEVMEPTAQQEGANLESRRNGRSHSDEEVAELAYSFWSEGGRIHGRHEEDWTRAVRELQDSA